MNPARYELLDQVLEQPVLKRELFPEPVIIESVELLRDRNNFICRVRSRGGAEGVSIGHPFIAKNSYPLFVNLLVYNPGRWPITAAVSSTARSTMRRRSSFACTMDWMEPGTVAPPSSRAWGRP